ncbi:AzlC family ABC transporter permease [Corynebacterium propinquum]|uniref:AzlC family ABC transporter permease n=1 Tax=Corynebacterium propinquum TaxID=43769 RepID=UPI00254358AD|nr:AzlC family ABC transporter permease [Corynebacterium propinquum]MDK4281706.1 AzlC family ABC transporter permease [Corynebacterium propinquum]
MPHSPSSKGNPASHTRRESVRAGLQEAAPVFLGLVPLGLAFGVFITQLGYAWWWAPIFSVVIYAGSMEFLAPGLIGAGVGPFSAALTGFMVNFRHIFYSLSFPREKIASVPGKIYSTYALTDEAYAISAARPHDSRADGTQVLTTQIALQASWVGSGTLAALTSAMVPENIAGMEFALTSLFIVLGWEAFAQHPDFSLVFAAGLCAVVAGVLVNAQMLVVSLCAYFCFVLLRHFSPAFDSWVELRVRR